MKTHLVLSGFFVLQKAAKNRTMHQNRVSVGSRIDILYEIMIRLCFLASKIYFTSSLVVQWH